MLKVDRKNIPNRLLHFFADSQDSQGDAPDITLPLGVLSQSDGYHEYWSDGSQVAQLKYQGETAFNAIESDEHLVIVVRKNDTDFAETVTAAYQFAYDSSSQLGYKHLLRTWNYINDINAFEQGIERYQTFCVARYQVMEQLDQLAAPNPAATAIGSKDGTNLFVFLFSKTPGTVIENKRQVSAWQYPKIYSPKQPRFSRAKKVGGLLMCSGTASVVGHETIHLDDLSSQFDECMTNVNALIKDSELPISLQSGLFRFYLRDPDLLDQVVDKINEYGINQYMVLEGDVCRENLLIECEAVFQSSLKPVKIDRL